MFIFKRELMFFFPPIFLMGYIYGHVPINVGCLVGHAIPQLTCACAALEP